MKKDTFYFSHDYNARNDDKIKCLIRKHGMLGYGIFWAIVEDLYNNANALRTDYEGIAYDMRVSENIIDSIINDFDLFVIDVNEFGSKSIESRLNERNEKSKTARESALSRWNKVKEDANALPTQSDSNAIKERKGKEINDNKEKEIKGNEKKMEVVFPFGENFKNFWLIWKEFKKKEFSFNYKSEISEQAAINELVKLGEGNEQKCIEIINQSLSKGWKGFFKIDNTQNGNSKTTERIGDRIRAKYNSQ